MKKNNFDKPSKSHSKHRQNSKTPLLDQKISNLKQTVSKVFRSISTRPAQAVKDFIQSISKDADNTADEHAVETHHDSAPSTPQVPTDLSGREIDIHDYDAIPSDKGWIWHKDRWVYVKDKTHPPESSNWCWLRNGNDFAWKYVGDWSANDLRPREGFIYNGGNYIFVQDRYNKPTESSTWVEGDMYSNAHWEIE